AIPKTTPEETAEQREDAPPVERERPTLMDSAERRTDEDGPPAEPVEPATISDDEIFFPRPAVAESASPASADVPEFPAKAEPAQELLPTYSMDETTYSMDETSFRTAEVSFETDEVAEEHPEDVRPHREHFAEERVPEFEEMEDEPPRRRRSSRDERRG